MIGGVGIVDEVMKDVECIGIDLIVFECVLVDEDGIWEDYVVLFNVFLMV